LRTSEARNVETMDVVVRNANVVTAAGRSLTDIGISNGRIRQMGGTISAKREIDAEGKIVTPGGVDAHVHLTPPSRITSDVKWSDDFESGSAAAAAGGVTTVGNMSFPERDETISQGIYRDVREAESRSLIDFFMHPVLLRPTEENLGRIKPLHDAGHTSIKFFMSYDNFDRKVSSFLKAMQITAEAGGIALIHCEDATVMACCCDVLRKLGHLGHRFFPEARPVCSEVVSTHRAVAFAEASSCPVYVVHLSSARALLACQDGRNRGVPVYVETRPLYLHLTSERYAETDGAKYAGAPPLRDQHDVNTLWSGLQFGSVDTLASDHAPWSLAQKLDPAFDATNLRLGVADLETQLPMLFSAGVRTGKLSLERFVAVTSTNPAKLFGLYPRKGTLVVGSDADLVIWNEEETRVIDGATMKSRCDYSPYDGMTVTGWPKVTLSRGEVIFDSGQIVSVPGRGRLAARGAHQKI
jgi:dihydropyrimidinase